MRSRSVGAIGVKAIVIAVVSLAPVPVAGPTPLGSFVGVADSPSFAGVDGGTSANPPEPSAEAGASGEGGPAQTAVAHTPPRTPWGEPDLQGIWDYRTITPLERPSELAGKQVFTEEEAAALEERTAKARVDDRYYWDRGTKVVGDKRTSLIVDPPDGRIPPLTPEGRTRAAAGRVQGTDGAEQRSLTERCITRTLPRLPDLYNNNYLIVQAPGYVVILMEMIHDARIIPLDGRPHLAPHLRQWHGDSRGRWEGNTLVVDTTNFTNKTNFRGSAENLHLVERFTRIDADTINYEFTIDDPSTFTRSWTAAIPLRKTGGLIYEYACHEGNDGLADILSVTRAVERAEEAAKKGSK